jgi:hypothetical protein
LRAAHTPNCPALLRQLGASLLVTTYQAGKPAMVRDEGDHLNTHYRSFQSPMGLALADGGERQDGIAIRIAPADRAFHGQKESHVGQRDVDDPPDGNLDGRMKRSHLRETPFLTGAAHAGSSARSKCLQQRLADPVRGVETTA